MTTVETVPQLQTTKPLSMSRGTLDPKALSRQVRSAMHSLDRLRASEAYWQIGAVVNEVRHFFDQVWTLIQADQGRDALGDIHTVQARLWTGYYAGSGRKAGIAQAKSLLDQIGAGLPLVGEAERPHWLSTQSLLLQWLVNATRETGDPRATLARAKRAVEIAKRSGLPDVLTVALMRQTETAYILGREDLALAYAHTLVTTPGQDAVINATRAIAAARVLALAVSD